MKVDVYFNLHKGLFSVRAMDGEHKGRVIGHCGSVALRNVRFVVQNAGRARVIAEGRKNVHAFARGELIAGYKGLLQDVDDVLAHPEQYRRATYNPYTAAHFRDAESGERLDSVEEVLCFLNPDRGTPQLSYR